MCETGLRYRKRQAVRFAMQQRKGAAGMLWALCVILLLVSPLGLFSGYTMGGVIHALLAITIIVLVIRLIERRRVL